MEFPNLGEHCSENSCKQLDFLPMRCDACEEIFCKDHITYANHKCMSSYKKDIQVPVCPLCNTPIPIKRGEMPDIKVGEHIDRDCQSDPAQNKRKIFTNKCSKGGCKQKEMIRVTCDQCHLNYCLKHRHPLDHDCKPGDKPVSKSGFAAFMRSQGASSSSASTSSSRGSSRPVSNGNARTQSSRSAQAIYNPAPAMRPPPAQNVVPVSASFQVGLTEEQALQRALEMSLAESARSTVQQPTLSPQEQEDLALAQALAASEEEYRRQQRRQQERESAKQSSCSLS
ncbi:AN1-type zinc finger protein 2A isoform X1 [Oncorhynchus mykiss]|uniref:AN1-type zinc finger protein 2A isoform X1 n=2 Tax=Oncorhynchus mykiss TaxID=8022 RepID=UPI000B4F6C75|nr:AN1-type zinc finger protein 2A isoform X1 [Oncorhynchus mykiss]XP_036796912.1 AN1-type zinc finger protein 2A isoform X1 [Oncorhynchus mykiss]